MDIEQAAELDYEEILKETPKAWHIRFSSVSIEWIPKSQGRLLNDRLYVAKWIMRDKNLERFEIR